MSLIFQFPRAIGKITGIDTFELSESKADWKSALLSGREGNDPVTLHIGKIDNENSVLISQSYLSEKSEIKKVGEMIKNNSLTLGYPLYYIKEALGLKEIPLNTLYLLLYRSASVVLEAERLHIQNTILIVESTCITRDITEMYQDFSNLLCGDTQINFLHKSNLKGRVNLYFGLFDKKQFQFN